MTGNVGDKYGIAGSGQGVGDEGTAEIVGGYVTVQPSGVYVGADKVVDGLGSDGLAGDVSTAADGREERAGLVATDGKPPIQAGGQTCVDGDRHGPGLAALAYHVYQ